jgi:putative aminopeptidase FrvX
MDQKSKDFLFELLRCPSPSGNEQEIQKLIHREFEGIAESIIPDIHGNLILGLNTKAKKRVMVASHCDQIGFMVKHISDKGFISVDKIGGTDDGVMLGSQMTIWTDGGPVDGVFGKKPIHLQSKSEIEQVPLLKNMWIDIGARDKQDAERQVKLGDYITFRLNALELSNNRITSPGLDNKAGLFVALEALRNCARSKLSFAVYIASTVQEEVGLRGATTAAAHLAPQVALAIDVTLASDDPGNTDPSTVDCKLGSGPCISHGPNSNPAVERLLLDAASRLKLPFQAAPSGDLEGNDSKQLQVAHDGVATASISIPERNMHTQVEVVDLQDLEHSIQLTTEFLVFLNEQQEFRPFYC